MSVKQRKRKGIGVVGGRGGKKKEKRVERESGRSRGQEIKRWGKSLLGARKKRTKGWEGWEMVGFV